MADRANKDNPTGLTAYFKAVKDIFELQTKVLTGALPHYAERGRNDEQRISKFLEQVLPRRYSLGTGFIICSDSSLPSSSQLDIVIHDEFFNSPLFRELAANIFPIESVYATIEVKTDLSFSKLKEAATAISDIRRMAKTGKYYAQFAPIEKSDDAMAGQPQSMEFHAPSHLAPRSYIVGYDAVADTPESFIERLGKTLDSYPGAFLHGVYAIKQNWFFCQEYRQPNFKSFIEDGLLEFVSKLISDLQSFPMKPMAFSRYVQNDKLRDIVDRRTPED